MTHSCSHFQMPQVERKLSKDWHKEPGCHTSPFFSIPLENVVIDELHLMLGVTDQLEEGIITDVLQWDEVHVTH